MKYLYLLTLTLFSWGQVFANGTVYKYADDIEASFLYWNGIQKNIAISLFSSYLLSKKNIYLPEEIQNCYGKITKDSSELDVVKCFSYDYLSYTMVLLSAKVPRIDNTNTNAGASLMRENSIGGRLYEGLLKIGFQRSKINTILGGYFISGRKPVSDFISLMKERERNNKPD